jgi:hypothetical protein
MACTASLLPDPNTRSLARLIPGRGLRENVPIEDVVAVLDSWDIRQKGKWTHWPGEPPSSPEYAIR